MAKTATVSTRSPFSFAVGNVILEEDVQEVVEMLNAAAGQTTTEYLSLVLGNSSWWTGGTGELATHDLDFTSGSFVRVIEGDFYIDSDDQVLTFEATCVIPATTTAEVQITIGGGSVLLTPFPANATTTLSGTVNVSTTGSGAVAWFIEVRRLSGAGTCNLRSVRVQSNTIAAASLPDPLNT